MTKTIIRGLLIRISGHRVRYRYDDVRYIPLRYYRRSHYIISKNLLTLSILHDKITQQESMHSAYAGTFAQTAAAEQI